MAENKTKATQESVESYLASIEDEGRREECRILCRLMAKAANLPPTMWGPSIVGFGSYHYQYESGREGDSCLVGFSCRKSEISVYGLGAAPNYEQWLQKLGKHKAGKGCLYIRTLKNIDLKVLEKLIAEATAAKARKSS